jgi:hypothetical protein
VVTTSGGSHTEIEYTSSPTLAREAIEQVIATLPTETDEPSGNVCAPAYSAVSWTGLTIISEFEFLPDGDRFLLLATEPTVDGVVVSESMTGYVVGDDAAELLTALPASQIEKFSDEGIEYASLAIDPVVSEQEAQNYEEGLRHRPGVGSELGLEDGLVTSIQAPVFYDMASGC